MASLFFALAALAYTAFPYYHYRRGDMFSLFLSILPYLMVIATVLLSVNLMSFAIGWAIGHALATSMLMLLRGR